MTPQPEEALREALIREARALVYAYEIGVEEDQDEAISEIVALFAAPVAGEALRRLITEEFRRRVTTSYGDKKAADYGQLLDWAWDSVLDEQRLMRAADQYAALAANQPVAEERT